MPNILFASNNPKHWGGNVVSANAAFDATRVPYSIAITQDIKSPKFQVSTTNDTFLHFQLQGNGIGSFSNSNITTAFRIRDHLNRTLISVIRQHYANYSITVYDANGGSNAIAGSGPLNSNQAWDIHVHHTDFVLEFKIYVQGVLMASHNYGTNPAGVTGIGYLETATGIRSGGTAYLSEVFVSDSSTVGGRLNMITPNNVGNYSQWLGDVPTLVDQELTTGLTTLSANQRTSLILNPYTKNEIISNMVVSSQNSKGVNAPTKVRHFLRRANVDYDAPIAHDVGSLITAHQTDYPLNPATSIPWVLGDVAITEFGFKSEA